MTKQQKKLCRDFFRRCGPNIKTMATAFESLPNIGFYIKDENGRIIAINRYNCEMCNIPDPDYAIGKRSSDIFPQAFADFCMARDDTVRKTGKPIINRRYMKPANLSVEARILSLYPVYDHDGNIIGTLCHYYRDKPDNVGPIWEDRFDAIIGKINDNIANPPSLKELSEEYGMSISHLQRMFMRIIGVMYGQTPYHPNRKPNGPNPHPAKTVPGRLTLNDRPAGANKRCRFGHYEMDTVVSSAKGKGGLLVLVDRKSRRYVIELIDHVTQEDVVKAIKRMMARKALGRIRSITTDNGCEFLNPQKIKEVVGCNIYYTRAYASWEKGSVENCNRLVRRWYPKKTDFSKCTRAEMHQLEKVINSIHRRIFNGKNAYEYDTAYSKSA